MTKREILLAICEAPGWSPSGDSSHMSTSLDQLVAEGWVVSRLDGYEATPQALEAYPRFAEQKDIAEALGDGTLLDPLPDEYTLPILSIADRQQIQAGIECLGLKGVLTLANIATQSDRKEVEIVIRVKQKGD